VRFARATICCSTFKMPMSNIVPTVERCFIEHVCTRCAPIPVGDVQNVND
jgi:hypothetical protein